MAGMSAAVTIIWDDDSYADAFRQLHAEYQESGYLRDSPGFVSLVGAGRIRERDPGKCSYCGEPLRRTEPGDGIDPDEYEWVHEDGNPICPIPAVAAP
jgi:hypothetical protein